MGAHQKEIIGNFRDEYHRCGGPDLPLDEMVLRFDLGFITFVYDSSTWVERDIYKNWSREEMFSWTGVLDPRFQAEFRCRCRTMTVINAFTLYYKKADKLKATFDEWIAGRGSEYVPQFS